MTGISILEALAQPMEDNEIEWKVQTVSRNNQGQLNALIVPYVQARAIQSRLDKVCGLLWQTKYRELTIFEKPAIECTISIFHNNVWISRCDAAEATQYESVKGGYSDALKRAAVQFGIGRFLYSLPQFWVPISNTRPQGQSEYIGGQYKVNGKNEYVKGYYTRPELNLNQNQAPLETGKQTSAAQQPSTKQSNKKEPTEYSPQQLQKEIFDCLQVLNINPQSAPNLFHYIHCPPKQLQHASKEELLGLYELLHPVKMYVLICTDTFKLSVEHQLWYASHFLEQSIGSYMQLIGCLDDSSIRIIFDIIRNDLNTQQRA